MTTANDKPGAWQRFRKGGLVALISGEVPDRATLHRRAVGAGGAGAAVVVPLSQAIGYPLAIASVTAAAWIAMIVWGLIVRFRRSRPPAR